MSPSNLAATSSSSLPFSVGRVPDDEASEPSAEGFLDRRNAAKKFSVRGERRQFGSSHLGLSDDGRELALAIDQYKVENHRRYLTCDEMLAVLKDLGYSK